MLRFIRFDVRTLSKMNKPNFLIKYANISHKIIILNIGSGDHFAGGSACLTAN